MEMWSKQKALAVFALVLYCFDNGSDFYVGIDLIIKCHVRYGCSVLGLVLLPGFIYGWFLYFAGEYISAQYAEAGCYYKKKVRWKTLQIQKL